MFLSMARSPFMHSLYECPIFPHVPQYKGDGKSRYFDFLAFSYLPYPSPCL
ncbi:hypothetical protein Dimus_039597 [Dionaea muscipula]